eukprot:c32154_g1_i1.p1 GENE.c32154_g1_i1~~c32154_g1_i1.p1  ORF type:complete len:405 (-),score=76.25 c32154_g1_i1:38-1252(-)
MWGVLLPLLSIAAVSGFEARIGINNQKFAECGNQCAYSKSPIFTIARHFANTEATSFLETGVSTSKNVIGMNTPFNVKCVCTATVNVPSNLKLPMEIPFGKCAATEVTIAMKEDGTGMSPDNVRKAFGNPLRAKWAKVKYHHFSDISGRTEAHILGIPGGDMAEFINALDAMEEMTNSLMTNADCKNHLQGFLKATAKISFYMSTDTQAVNLVSANVQMPNLDLRETPPDSEVGRLLNALVLPENNGCRVLRNMIMKPENYNLRSGLPQCAIRAFYEVLWDKQDESGRKLRLVELEGADSEKAVVKVKTSAACTDAGIHPLVQPKGNNVCDSNGCGKSMFVTHQAAAGVLREEFANYFAVQDSRVDSQRMLEILNANGQIYENRAIEYLARSDQTLPVYEVTIK